MSDEIKVSELATAQKVNGTDTTMIIQKGVNKKTEINELLKVHSKKTLSITTEILSNRTITIPLNYQVGSGVLDVYLNGELLKLCSTFDDLSTGHYSEVGTTGVISNQIKITSDWSLSEGDILTILVRGEWKE